MKMPVSPPSFSELLSRIQGKNSWERLIDFSSTVVGDDRYLHWDKLIHLKPPEKLSHEEWWWVLKMRRRFFFRNVALKDKQGNPFRFLINDRALESLQQVDLWGGGRVEMPDPIINPAMRDRYYISSLIEEAITSSQLEGAATTREVAKDMIRSGRAPSDRSERMILNNFRTMEQIGEIKERPLTKELIFEIHRLVTEGTLDDSSGAGRFRRTDEQRVVMDDFGRVFHTPPAADELETRISEMLEFANGRTPKGFVHPAVRSILLHFWLAYDHPFIDGNGRTARALFYWSMLHHNYWLFEFISISSILLKAPAQYGRAFLYTETDENDLTYFILYHLDVIERALAELKKYIERKTAELQTLETRLRKVSVLNHRQSALISHALRHPGHAYTIASHQTSHKVVYQTARTDLFDLRDRGLLEVQRIGRTYYFRSPANLEDKLQTAR